MIVITSKTRNTKAFRLRVYKAMLKHMIENNNPYYGFCRTLSLTINISLVCEYFCYDCQKSNFCYRLKKNRDTVYEELMSYAPNEKEIKNLGEYWFKPNVNGWKHRIKILKEIIHNMEKD